MIPLTIDSVKTYLESKKIEVVHQKETNQLSATLKIFDFQIPLFIRIFDGGELLQILVFFPCNTTPTSVAEVARLLHFLNKEIDMPGFGMDESVHVVFYRSMVTARGGQLDTKIFDAFFGASQMVCQTFTPLVAAVATGAVTYADVVKQAKEKKDQLVNPK